MHREPYNFDLQLSFIPLILFFYQFPQVLSQNLSGRSAISALHLMMMVTYDFGIASIKITPPLSLL
jgi:hypothetical protein